MNIVQNICKYKILAVIPGTEGGSELPFSRDQIGFLRKSGLNISTYYLRSRINPWIIIKSILELISRAKSEDAHIVHSHYGTVTGFVSVLASICAGKKAIVTFHGSDLNPTDKSDGIFRDFAQRVLSNLSVLGADSVICVSLALKNRLWWGKRKVRVIPCGIDLEVFRPLGKAQSIKELGWDKNERYVLFNNSNNAYVKRQDIAEQALLQVKRIVPNVTLVILNNIPGNRIPLFINAADCLLICSDSEGSPTILKEAMACNLPVVAVNVGDVAERLTGCSHSEIVEQSPEDIASGILNVIKASSRSNGRQLIANLSQEAICNQVNALYSEILSEKLCRNEKSA